MKDSETEKNCNEKKPCTKLPVRKDEREVKWQKGEIVFSFLQISPMVIINQVQWPLVFTLTPYWSIVLACYLNSAKSVLQWYYIALMQDEGGLHWPLMLVKLINCAAHWLLTCFPPHVTLFLLLFLPSSLFLPDRRETLCKTVATLKYTDSSLRFSGCAYTGINLTPQNLTANPNPVV